MNPNPSLEELRGTMSRAEAARQLRTSYMNLYRIERKGQLPGGPLILLMAQLYGVEEGEILRALSPEEKSDKELTAAS